VIAFDRASSILVLGTNKPEATFILN